MSKRYTDSRKWQKNWLIELDNQYKLLWIYILDTCTIAGIWDVSFVIPQAIFRCRYNYNEVLAALGKQVVPITENKWLIRDFIAFQYKKLNHASPPHKAVIDELTMYGLWDEEAQAIRLPEEQQGLFGPTQGNTAPKGHVSRKKVLQLDNEPLMYGSDAMQEAWAVWREYKSSQWGFRYKSPTSEQKAINELINLSRNDGTLAMRIVNRSISQGWKGLFEIKQENRAAKPGKTTDETLEEWHGQGNYEG